MHTDISYYFEHPEKFPITGFLDGLHSTFEILAHAKSYLRETLTEPGICENHGTINGGEVNFIGNYYIGEGTVIYGGATIIGPVYIGKNCEIMPNAVIRPNTILGDGCHVGTGSEVKRGILFSGAKVASLSFVGDSVLGTSARIGSGVITANRKFNQSEVTLKADGTKHNLGDTYFGVILGDSARLGANCVTQPGTHIGPYSWIFPMTNVRGFIPSEKRVFHPHDLAMEDNGRVELAP